MWPRDRHPRIDPTVEGGHIPQHLRRRPRISYRRQVGRLQPVSTAMAIGLIVVIIVSIVLTVTLVGSSQQARRGQQRRAITTSTAAGSTSSTTSAPPVWRVAWGSATAWGNGQASNVTVRDLATVGIGGEAVRIRISNVFGNEPLVIGAASVGLAATGASVIPGTLHAVTFGGVQGTTVPVGQVVYSDAVSMIVSDLQTLAISVYVRTASWSPSIRVARRSFRTSHRMEVGT